MGAKKQSQASVRLDPAIKAVVEQVAVVERRSISNVLRIALEDWAKARENNGNEVAA